MNYWSWGAIASLVMMSIVLGIYLQRVFGQHRGSKPEKEPKPSRAKRGQAPRESGPRDW